ncbi:MAG: hypothetical protein ACI8VW_002730 [bacterium]|jgi:hypothetical protein
MPHQFNVEYNTKGTGFWAIVQTVLVAGIGVQSRANKERDFKARQTIALLCWRSDRHGIVHCWCLAASAIPNIYSVVSAVQTFHARQHASPSSIFAPYTEEEGPKLKEIAEK